MMDSRRRILQPRATHFGPITCAEDDCDHYLKGWVTTVPDASPQADYIRRDSGREFREERVEGGMVAFTFASGQTCFQQHRGLNGTPPLYVKERPGARTVQQPDRWMYEFNEEVYKHEQAIKGG